MTTKTITVTEDAYEALKRMQEEEESFSKTLLRISAKRSLREFIGLFSSDEAEKLKTAIKEIRLRHNAVHQERLKKIVSAFGG